MHEETTTTQETEDEAQSRDLRAELLQDLITRFSTALDSRESIPAAAREALVELLDGGTPTATDIINAVSRNDPDEESAEDE